MEKSAASAITANQFSRSAKIDESQIIRLVYYFCNGLPVAAAARGAAVTVKTAREHYIALRGRLTDPKFGRWHGAHVQATNLDPEIMAELVKPAFFDVLAQCHANEKCAQNYRLGYRKQRLCRVCPLDGKFTSGERLAEALMLIDTVRAFYETLGIRGEKARDPVSLFRERMIHTVTIATALANSKTRGDGLKNPVQKDFLSLGTLLDMLLEDLAARPL